MRAQGGFTSILAGLSFGWATNTSITYLPSSTTLGGAAVMFQAVTVSLNPNLLNVTDGNMTFYINGFYFMSATVVGEATSHFSSMQAHCVKIQRPKGVM